MGESTTFLHTHTNILLLLRLQLAIARRAEEYQFLGQILNIVLAAVAASFSSTFFHFLEWLRAHTTILDTEYLHVYAF